MPTNTLIAPHAAAPVDLSNLAPGELITETEAAEILNCARATLANARSLRKGPPFIRIGTMVRYFRSRLTDWSA